MSSADLQTLKIRLGVAEKALGNQATNWTRLNNVEAAILDVKNDLERVVEELASQPGYVPLYNEENEMGPGG